MSEQIRNPIPDSDDEAYVLAQYVDYLNTGETEKAEQLKEEYADFERLIKLMETSSMLKRILSHPDYKKRFLDTNEEDEKSIDDLVKEKSKSRIGRSKSIQKD